MKTSPQRKPRPVKAHKVIAADIPWSMRPGSKPTKPYYIIPGSAEAYDAMVEQMAKAQYLDNGNSAKEWGKPESCAEEVWRSTIYRRNTQLALAAIGITRPTHA